MITNKDIRVENGSLIINGDPYPLDGQSPEAIMQIVKDNSDTTPTENSTAPITSGGVFAADKAISDTIGDITQTGITGADVASQLEKVNNDIEGLILSDFSDDSIDVDGTYQIPSTMLAKDIIVIGVTRASFCGSIVISTIQIKNGNCSNGLKIVSGDGSSPTTDKYAILTISKTGLITVKYLSNWSPVYVALKAI